MDPDRRKFLSASVSTAATAAFARALNAEAAPAQLSSKSAHEPLDVTIVVNGRERRMALDPRTSLLDALREHLGLTGTKKGCDHGQCGACTVLLNGRRVNACLTLAAMLEGDDITTIEGLGAEDALHPLQAAFIAHDAFQCGYCTS